jgi:hypothetical protein
MASAASLLHLRESLRARFPMHVVEQPERQPETGLSPVPSWSSGVDALDQVLGPHWRAMEGGVVALAGARSSGRTALLGAVLARRAAMGESSALVDASRTFPAAALADAAAGGRLVVVRPPRAADAAWAADQLLRSAAFSLVAVAGGAAPAEPVLRRLAGLARQAGAKVLLLPDGAPPAAAPCALVRQSVVPAGPAGGAEILLRALPRAGAPARSARLALEFHHEDRLPPGARAPDRRPRAR